MNHICGSDQARIVSSELRKLMCFLSHGCRTNKRITICFRGSVGGKDWATNLNFLYITPECIRTACGDDVKIHKGFAGEIPKCVFAPSSSIATELIFPLFWSPEFLQRLLVWQIKGWTIQVPAYCQHFEGNLSGVSWVSVICLRP